MGRPAAEVIAGGGCRYIHADGSMCGQQQRSRSSYCAPHHALCYLATGSREEDLEQRAVDATAELAAGRLPNRKVKLAVWMEKMKHREAKIKRAANGR